MDITVYFANSNMREYKTIDSAKAPWDKAPFGCMSNCGHNVTVLLDDLSCGLWVKYDYHNAADKSLETYTNDTHKGCQVEHGVQVRIVDADEMKNVVSIHIDGNEVVRKVDGELVNVKKLDVLDVLYGKPDMNLFEKIYKLYNFFHDGGETDESIAATLGFTDKEFLIRVINTYVAALEESDADAEQDDADEFANDDTSSDQTLTDNSERSDASASPSPESTGKNALNVDSGNESKTSNEGEADAVEDLGVDDLLDDDLVEGDITEVFQPSDESFNELDLM